MENPIPEYLSEGSSVKWIIVSYNSRFLVLFLVLIDKDNNPHWNPASYKEVTDARLEWFFSPLDPELEPNLRDD